MTFLARDESRPATGPHHSVLSDSYKGARGLKAANAGLHRLVASCHIWELDVELIQA